MNRAPQPDLSQRIAAALGFDRRVDLHHSPLRVTAEGGMVVLQGEVRNIAAKRVAMRIARELAAGEFEVVDAIDVRPAQPRPDGEIADALARSLLEVAELKSCGLKRGYRSHWDTLREPAPDGSSCGEVAFAVSNGVVELGGHVGSLSHRRLVEALAWWVGGCRNVIDRLRVEPPEEDNDGELADAVRLVLEVDPSLPQSDEVGLHVALGVVTLGGRVQDEAHKRRAELDAWCVDGVREVLNGIHVVH